MTRFTVLAVCTGNICRSPFVERLLKSRLREALGADADRFTIGSAGTHALVGQPIAEPAAALLVERSADPTGFVARELTADLVHDADLVLAATRDHRAAAVTLQPRAAARTMTVREFARLLAPVAASDIAGSDPVERMAAIVAAARANRGLVAIGDPDDDDIADPYRRKREAYILAGQQIADVVDVILERLVPAVSG
ncbi:MAG TPA: low molecular weight phosphatase family protein [Mycobacteriales bacterium]|nr:low molecular weight phosphatase family protein [Mycobacteriales bacterium]